uniref:Protein prenyltransferase alpha subunit repeat containing 1 n=2 Tax=Latimeria chalumnae TaxID=7897 RepID=H3A6T8_LATCH|nr:PREDICTED: protein prenyltransferase alpha subunit repeat-containing protein 1 [Latimeria chalumnae]|eukprot:XP_006004275.1 PREDICTED: protein prenyltransferase alpha subunit repeat-containing protein 1 [Latimeria chalumnae]
MAESDEEVDVLVQRVVKDINNVFKKNPNIDEIGLIPCPEAIYNRSPIVLVGNKLGVESWCIKFLLPYVHNKLLLYRQRKQWLDRDVLIDITCTLLLLNPDFTTAWNVRKELVESGALNPVKDLHLGKLALTKFPKSPETWIHRRWLLQQLTQETFLPNLESKDNSGTFYTEKIQQIVQEEITVCSEASGRYPSNYNAWSHRIWVVQHLAKCSVKLLLDELSSTKYWVSMHVSDHSGFHFRQFLLKALVSNARSTTSKTIAALHPLTDEQILSLPKEQGANAELQRLDIPQLFEEELELCTSLIESFPGHETLWCHRRHVFYLWHCWNNKHHCASVQLQSINSSDGTLNNLQAGTAGSHLTQAMEVDGTVDLSKQAYTQETKRLKRGPQQQTHGLAAEHRFIDNILTGYRDAEQARFATAYKKWLDTVIGQ